MNINQSRSYMIGRRSELIAEMFLQDLNASFVAKSTADMGYDLIAGFPNHKGGFNNYVVQVKATENPVSSRFPINSKLYEILAHSNIPALLLVVDVKQNRLFFAWITPDIREGHLEARSVMIPVVEVDAGVKEELRKKLSD